jgi:signal transduction histidine kinase
VRDVGDEVAAQRLDAPFALDRLPRDRALREAVTGALAGTPTESAELEVGGRTLALTARPLTGGGAVLALYDLTTQRRLEAVRRDFVANVSHELKTPLTVVGGFAETLLDDDVNDEQRRHFADAIVINARRMQRIVDDLLDLSRIESGGWRPNPGVVDLRTAAPEAMEVAQGVAERKGVVLALDVRDDARAVWADSTAIRQVIVNLVDNAVRHTTGAVALSVGPDGDEVVVRVDNDGPPIPEADRDSVFERFTRLQESRQRDTGGSGLGLAIVRTVAVAHGGSAIATQTPSGSCRFEVRLPADEGGGSVADRGGSAVG